MKKFFAIMLGVLLIGSVAFAAVACNNTGNDTINVYSREDGSGTRSAFVELTGVLVEGEDGSETDMTFSGADIFSGTNELRTAVQNDKNGIGYISYGSLSDSVKAVSVDGVAPSTETIKSGEYKIARPFNVAYKAETLASNALLNDFVTNFLGSAQAQEVINDEKYVTVVEDAAEYVAPASAPAGEIAIGGSSSVYPLMEKLIAKYVELSGVDAAKIELSKSDSSGGMRDVASGTIQLGMASREVKQSEIENGLTPLVIANDGIAVIVNNKNAVNNLTMEQIRLIFTGELRNWADITSAE